MEELVSIGYVSFPAYTPAFRCCAIGTLTLLQLLIVLVIDSSM